jgi:carbon storage regulator
MKRVKDLTRPQEGMLMLVLTRRPGEEIVIAGKIRITITSVKGDRIRLGIDAPPSVAVDRKEVHERRRQLLDPEPEPVIRENRDGRQALDQGNGPVPAERSCTSAIPAGGAAHPAG